MKIQLTLDAAKLRPLVQQREYTNKDGEQVVVQEIKIEVVPLKEENQKVVYETDRYRLVKTHFAVAPQTKEEREAKAPAVYVGEGIVTVWRDNEAVSSTQTTQPATTAAAPGQDDCPF